MADSPKKFSFTKRKIDALPANDPDSSSTDAEYTDLETPGLKLTVSKSGRKAFLYRYTFKGVKRCMSLGVYGVIDVEEARKKARDVKRAVTEGIDPASEKQKESRVPTFSSFVTTDYLPWARQNKRSHDDDRSKFDTHILNRFGSRQLDAISARDIQAYLSFLREEKGLKPATANLHLFLLSAVFRLAMNYELVEKNPCANVKKFEVNNACHRYLNGDELRRLHQAMEEKDENGGFIEPNRVAVNVIKLLLLTGVRREEAMHAKWTEIDFERGQWFLPHTKNGHSRHVALNDGAIELLQSIEQVSGNDYVFVNPRTKERLNTPVKTFKRLLDRAGIENVRIHDLRHTFASIVANSGESMYILGSLLGHRSVQTTQRYAHLSTDALRQVSGKVDSAMREAQSGSN